MPALPFPDERIFLRQVREVTCGCRRRCAGDGAVLAGTHAALESFRPLPEHPKERFFLPLVERSADTVEQLRLVDEEFGKRKGAPLRFDGRAGKPGQPVGDFIALVATDPGLWACR